jgi:hypothetical protein
MGANQLLRGEGTPLWVLISFCGAIMVVIVMQAYILISLLPLVGKQAICMGDIESNTSGPGSFSTVDECVKLMKQDEPAVVTSSVTYNGAYREFTLGVKYLQDYNIVCRGNDLISETPVGNVSVRGYVNNLCS